MDRAGTIADLARAKAVFQQRAIVTHMTGRPPCPTCDGTGSIPHHGHGTEADSPCPDCTTQGEDG